MIGHHKRTIEGFTLIGLAMEGKTTNENNRSSMDCGSLWQRFEKENIQVLIPNKVGDEIYAAYHAYERENKEYFSYFIGCKVSRQSSPPSSLDLLEIPAQTCIRAVVQGSIPKCINDTWKNIWQSDINRAYGFDYEVYGEKSKNWSNAELDIFVSVS